MPDEMATVNPDTPLSQTVVTANPSWVGNTENIIKALMQGQRPAAAADAPADSPQANAAAPQDIPVGGLSPGRFPQIPNPITAHNTGSAATKPQIAPLPVRQIGAIPQLPYSAIAQMQQHQINPAVEAAKQRVLQALLQRHATPTAPLPTAKV